jgi:hypothetical protein
MKSRLPVSALTVTLGTAALFGFFAANQSGGSGQAAAAQAPQRVPAAASAPAGAVNAECGPGGSCGQSGAAGDALFERLVLPEWITSLVDTPVAGNEAGNTAPGGAAGQTAPGQTAPGQTAPGQPQSDQPRTLPAPAGQTFQGGQGTQGTKPQVTKPQGANSLGGRPQTTRPQSIRPQGTKLKTTRSKSTRAQSAPASVEPARGDSPQGVTTRGETRPLTDSQALALTETITKPLGVSGVTQLGGLLGNGFPGNLESVVPGQPELETNLPDGHQLNRLAGNLNVSRQLGGITAVPGDIARADAGKGSTPRSAAGTGPKAAPVTAGSNPAAGAPGAASANERRALPAISPKSLPTGAAAPLTPGLDLISGLTNGGVVERLTSGGPLGGAAGLPLTGQPK